MDDRRDFLKKLLLGLSGLSVAGAAFQGKALGPLAPDGGVAEAATTDMCWIEGKDPYANTVKALNTLGGMKRFVKKGQKVTVLPNVGWARTPEQAACTNPAVVRAVIDECKKAGAKSVSIFGNPCNDGRVCFDLSGIAKAVEAAGAHWELINNGAWVKRSAPKLCTHIKSAEVYRLVTDGDVLINVPVAKHHGGSKLTMCCKNLMGAVRDRGYIHQSLHEGIADLAIMIPSALCVLDATRILVRNGPTGGNLKDVVVKNTIIAGINPGQVDALGTSLFGMQPSEIEYLKILAGRAYCVIDPAKLRYVKAKA